MLHRFPDDDGFTRRLRRSQLDYVCSSRAAAATLAENYVGLGTGRGEMTAVERPVRRARRARGGHRRGERARARDGRGDGGRRSPGDPRGPRSEDARGGDGPARRAGGQVSSLQVDVSDRDQVQELFEGVVAEQGGVDVLYANAGISLEPGITDPDGGIAAIETEAWERVLGVNLNGVVFTMGAAAEVMKKQGSGKIVVTASNAGLKVEPLVGYSYAATKAAVIHVVRQAAVELGRYGINVNAIAPGPVPHEDRQRRAADERIEEIWADLIPLGRMAETDELKGLILLLGSPAASFITGSVVLIDGGAMPSSFREQTSLSRAMDHPLGCCRACRGHSGSWGDGGPRRARAASTPGPGRGHRAARRRRDLRLRLPLPRRRAPDLRGVAHFPRILGHEFTATIEQLGPGLQRPARGRRPGRDPAAQLLRRLLPVPRRPRQRLRQLQPDRHPLGRRHAGAPAVPQSQVFPIDATSPRWRRSPSPSRSRSGAVHRARDRGRGARGDHRRGADRPGDPARRPRAWRHDAAGRPAPQPPRAGPRDGRRGARLGGRRQVVEAGREWAGGEGPPAVFDATGAARPDPRRRRHGRLGRPGHGRRHVRRGGPAAGRAFVEKELDMLGRELLRGRRVRRGRRSSRSKRGRWSA